MTRNDLTTNFLLTGVGGQGTLLAADVVGLVGMQLNLDVKKSEVHGMAQRGGSVISHVRWGERVHSPLIAAGEVDYLIAFERLEALRYAPMVRPGGIVLVNDYRMMPVSVSSGDDTYPDPAAEERACGDSLQRFLVPAIEIAQQLGQSRVNNVVMLGALSHFLPAPVDVWLEVISGRVPERTIALNRDAFAAGRAYMQ